MFRLVWDPSKNEEVYGIACCAVCKVFYIKINGEQIKINGYEEYARPSKESLVS